MIVQILKSIEGGINNTLFEVNCNSHFLPLHSRKDGAVKDEFLKS